mmetsp:Transcript_6543/g.19305  ORF Transcript_6543/g.19305 Transcript_6543/m.19305 type:complete len:242 (+) Transcript_6543:1848-2573(+)
MVLDVGSARRELSTTEEDRGAFDVAPIGGRVRLPRRRGWRGIVRRYHGGSHEAGCVRGGVRRVVGFGGHSGEEGAAGRGGGGGAADGAGAVSSRRGHDVHRRQLHQPVPELEPPRRQEPAGGQGYAVRHGGRRWGGGRGGFSFAEIAAAGHPGPNGLRPELDGPRRGRRQRQEGQQSPDFRKVPLRHQRPDGQPSDLPQLGEGRPAPLHSDHGQDEGQLSGPVQRRRGERRRRHEDELRRR